MSTPPAIGDVRYVCYPAREPGGPPYVGRVRLESTSPKGRKARWRDLDTRAKGLDTYDAGYPPAATPDRAIREFQVRQAFGCYLADSRGDREAADRCIRRIVAAEALREGEPFADEDA